MSALPEADAASAAPRHPLEASVISALKRCYDPEIPVDIYELGLIYSIEVTPENVANVKMTLTAPACPVAGSLPGDVEREVRKVEGIVDAKVELVWDPAWRPDMMSKVARVMLGM